MDGQIQTTNEAILVGIRVSISGEGLKMRGTGNQRQCLEQATQKINISIMENRVLPPPLP